MPHMCTMCLPQGVHTAVMKHFPKKYAYAICIMVATRNTTLHKHKA
jgi:hypothetical protein